MQKRPLVGDGTSNGQASNSPTSADKRPRLVQGKLNFGAASAFPKVAPTASQAKPIAKPAAPPKSAQDQLDEFLANAPDELFEATPTATAAKSTQATDRAPMVVDSPPPAHKPTLNVMHSPFSSATSPAPSPAPAAAPKALLQSSAASRLAAFAISRPAASDQSPVKPIPKDMPTTPVRAASIASPRSSPSLSPRSLSATPVTDSPLKPDEDRWMWLHIVRDEQKRTEQDQNYDPTTLFIPEGDFSKLTPTRKQYWGWKRKHFDWILWFQVGDFYELYEQDCDWAEREFGLKVTRRTNMSSCGVNQRQIDDWANRTYLKGRKVAVMSQSGEVTKTGGKTDCQVRKITEFLTPGTRLYSPYVTDADAKYLLCIREGKDPDGQMRVFGVAYLDAATARVSIGRLDDDDRMSNLSSLIFLLKPKEIVYASGQLSPAALKLFKGQSCMLTARTPSADYFSRQTTTQAFNTAGYFPKGWPETLQKYAEDDLVLLTVGLLAHYLRELEVDVSLLGQGLFTDLAPVRSSLLAIDGTAALNLELLHTIDSMREQGSLFSVICHCSTPFGRRQLREWIMHPLLDVDAINTRLDAVEELMNNAAAADFLRVALHRLPDLERVLSLFHGSPSRVSLKIFTATVNSFRMLWETFVLHRESFSSALLRRLLNPSEGICPDISEEVKFWTDALDWGESATQARVIPQAGASAEYDEANKAVSAVEEKLNRYLEEQRKALKLRSMKFNEKYQLEVPTADGEGFEFPKDYEEGKHTKQVMRFDSPTTRKLVGELEAAHATRNELSSSLLLSFVQKFDEAFDKYRDLVRNIAEVDCLLSLATVAVTCWQNSDGVCRPRFRPLGSAPLMRVIASRHPTLEAATNQSVIPNDIVLGGSEPPVNLLTGPNMGGKSTVLRQACLVTILAQIGSFVPAKECELSVVDRIFTRIGARDNIFIDQSTFMVELLETSSILQHATSASLVILDELGRGTSTYDGYSIAYAVLKHIADTIGCRTLFSTHHHNLTEEFALHPCIAPFFMFSKVDADERTVTPMYKMKRGVCPKSYGMNVAAAAGIERPIIDRATEKAAEHLLEETNRRRWHLVQSILGHVSKEQLEQAQKRAQEELRVGAQEKRAS